MRPRPLLPRSSSSRRGEVLLATERAPLAASHRRRRLDSAVAAAPPLWPLLQPRRRSRHRRCPCQERCYFPGSIASRLPPQQLSLAREGSVAICSRGLQSSRLGMSKWRSSSSTRLALTSRHCRSCSAVRCWRSARRARRPRRRVSAPHPRRRRRRGHKCSPRCRRRGSGHLRSPPQSPRRNTAKPTKLTKLTKPKTRETHSIMRAAALGAPAALAVSARALAGVASTSAAGWASGEGRRRRRRRRASLKLRVQHRRGATPRASDPRARLGCSVPTHQPPGAARLLCAPSRRPRSISRRTSRRCATCGKRGRAPW